MPARNAKYWYVALATVAIAFLILVLTLGKPAQEKATPTIATANEGGTYTIRSGTS